MIAPSFALTATERALPKLALDFTTALLDPRVTFTRSGNTATVTNSSGLIVGVNADTPRFDYDPITLACKGLLIEESRTNICLYSNLLNFSGVAFWIPTRATVSATAGTSPDGTNNAFALLETATTGTHYNNQAGITTVSGTTYTFSMFVKANGRTWALLQIVGSGVFPSANFNLSNGTVGTVNGAATATLTDVGDGWYRATITAATDTTSSQVRVYTMTGDNVSSFAGDVAKGLLIYGAQLEAGAFATSYIPTTTTALTRNADVAVMTGTNFSDWYNAGTGAFNCTVLPKSAAGTKPVLQFDDATVLNTIVMQENATAVELKITTLGVLQSTLSTGTITANTAYSSCGAWTAGSNVLSKSGGVAATGSPASIPTVTQSRLGSNGTNYFNGWLQKINYWPQRITDAETRAFST